MSWRRNERVEDTSGFYNPHLTESQRLEAADLLVVSVERMRETLALANSRLGLTGRTCVLRTGQVALGQVCLLPVPEVHVPPLTTDGPASLLCGQPVLGAMPWQCRVHWLALRAAPIVRRHVLLREARRLRKREGGV